MKRLINLATILLLVNGCTHYQAISAEELEAKNLVGRWEMSLNPYHITFNCDGTMSFVKPSKYLYGDQIGHNFIVTEIQNNKIISGPVLRYDLNVDDWPHDEFGRIVMNVEGRVWHKAQSFHCQ